MGWGTVFHGYLSKISKTEIDDKIVEATTQLENITLQLVVLACVTPVPKKDSEGNSMEVHEWLPMEVTNLLNEYREAAELLGLLKQAQDYFEQKDEEIIENEKNHTDSGHGVSAGASEL